MSDVAGTAIVSISLAAATGLTFLAYKHPRSYIRLHPFLTGVLSAFFAGVLIWNASNEAVFSAVIRYEVVGDRGKSVADAIQYLQVPTWWIGASVGAFVYLVFLSSFPMWLVENEPAKTVDAVPNQRTDQAEKGPVG